MTYSDLDFDLSPEERAQRDLARRFGAEVLRPAGIALDRLADPAAVVADDSPLWDVVRQYRELGLHRRGLPEAVGGFQDGSSTPMSSYVITEELGYADAGLAISLGVAAHPFTYAAMSDDAEIRDWARAFCADTEGELIGCWAVTEPDHGSDWISAPQPGPELEKRDRAPNVKAKLVGDHYVLNGQKSAWVSNGSIATHAALHLSLDPAQGMHGTGICVLPLDLPGIWRGAPLDKLGQRPLNQGEIFFHDVCIPKKYMVVPDTAGGTAALRNILTGANTSMSILFAGLAKAAFDEALAYARQRVQGGVPIFEHQNVKLKLMHMFDQVEAARSLSRRVFLHNAARPPGSFPHAISAKIRSTESAFAVAAEAIQVFGGIGLTRDCPIEKIFRDAKASMIEDGENSALALTGAAFL
jgi:alkylation response protein AidB-like acyl-CoA dehydrogenase